MGETLGIAKNVFEKAERERDRKERLKALEDWNKEKKERMKRASIYGAVPVTITAAGAGANKRNSTASRGGGVRAQDYRGSYLVFLSSHKNKVSSQGDILNYCFLKGLFSKSSVSTHLLYWRRLCILWFSYWAISWTAIFQQ